ncbi:MAG: RagB/SusD family nutrient uptake outer membrane protein [Alistipes sp.]|nr:RagB/SusD family nutrient uptake outer membrane protein [Alistipes sp.]MDE6862421.1 RagB/SusD family nutrient uptake outer membrane protein [Alistipes sp.]
MKTTKIILAALLSSAVATSCIKEAYHDSYLGADRKNEIAEADPDKVFASQEQSIYTYLYSYVYQNVNHNYFGQKSFDYLTSLMGNDMVLTGRFAMSYYHYLLDYGTSGNYATTGNRYNEYYAHIAIANEFLASIDKDTENADLLRYRAVALTARGYAYWQLTNLYQRAYYVGADDTVWGKGNIYDWSQYSCVPIVTEELTGNQPLSTVEQVYEQMLGDLEEAYAIFERIGKIHTPSPADFDGCVAATYLYRAYMVKHDWANAAKYAQVVMDNIPILTTESDLTQGFSLITLPDVVMGFDITVDTSTVYMSFFSQMDAYGDGYAGIGVFRVGFKPFVDRIADNDVRLQWFCNHARSTDRFLRDTDVPADEPYQSVKFIGAGRDAVKALPSGSRSAAGWELGDYIYLRSEEAWFTKAEALAHQGDLTGARNTLAQVLASRIPGYVCLANTKADVIEEINFQKRVEFWGEGIEYIDNRRLNIPVDRLDATWGAANNNHYEDGKIRVEQEASKMVYYIPTREIEANLEINFGDQQVNVGGEENSGE